MPFPLGAWLEILEEVASELLRPPVPTILRGVLRGGLILKGPDMFRAGLYVGLGSFGRDAANCVFNGSMDGYGGMCNGGRGMSRGPSGRIDEA